MLNFSLDRAAALQAAAALQCAQMEPAPPLRERWPVLLRLWFGLPSRYGLPCRPHWPHATAESFESRQTRRTWWAQLWAWHEPQARRELAC